MSIRTRVADLTVRAAAAVGGRVNQPEKSRGAVLCYRLAGAVIALCGGRLESRIMSLVVPDGETDEELTAVLNLIQDTLDAQRVSLRVAETRLSREEALASEDVRSLVPDGVATMTFCELWVPTHDFWKASHLVEKALERRSSELVPGLDRDPA